MPIPSIIGPVVLAAIQFKTCIKCKKSYIGFISDGGYCQNCKNKIQDEEKKNIKEN